MKKTLTCLLSCLLAVLCLFTCIGCNEKPALSINEADAALTERGYEVEIEYGDADYISIEGVVKKSLYAEKGEDNITIIEFEKASTAKRFYKMRKESINATISYMEQYIAWYEHLLDEYNDEMSSDDIDDMQDDLKDLRKEIKEAEEELEAMGRSGKFVWYASDVDVIKDAQ